MHSEALGGGVAEFDEAVEARACPYLNELGETALNEMRTVYEQIDAGNYDALGDLAERLAAAAEPNTVTTDTTENQRQVDAEPRPEPGVEVDLIPAATQPPDYLSAVRQAEHEWQLQKLRSEDAAEPDMDSAPLKETVPIKRQTFPAPETVPETINKNQAVAHDSDPDHNPVKSREAAIRPPELPTEPAMVPESKVEPAPAGAAEAPVVTEPTGRELSPTIPEIPPVTKVNDGTAPAVFKPPEVMESIAEDQVTAEPPTDNVAVNVLVEEVDINLDAGYPVVEDYTTEPTEIEAIIDEPQAASADEQPSAFDPETIEAFEPAIIEAYQELMATVDVVSTFDISDDDKESNAEPMPDFESFIAEQSTDEQPMKLESIRTLANEQPLEKTFAQLVAVLPEIEDKEEKNELQRIMRDIEVMLPKYQAASLAEEKPGSVITPALTDKLLMLLRTLGYEHPREELVRFVGRYGLVFLIQALQYMYQLSIESNRQEFAGTAVPPLMIDETTSLRFSLDSSLMNMIPAKNL
jgi:hypothetical protein